MYSYKMTVEYVTDFEDGTCEPVVLESSVYFFPC